jgi:PAS domain S-box-containing protein
MQAGAADYLVKGQFRGDSLVRSIRYALQRQRAAAVAAFDQARLASFGAEIGLALTRRDTLEAILKRCAGAMAQFLNAALAQISVVGANQTFEPAAMAGPLCSGFASLEDLPKVGLFPSSFVDGKPVLIRQVIKDPRLHDQGWAHREGVTSYAAFPLMLEDKLVGAMSLFTQQPVHEQITQEMGSVANGIALCIERKRAEEALDRSEVKYRTVVESIKEVIFQLDEFGQWTCLNPAWTAITGFDVTPTLGTFFLPYFHQEDREQNRHIFLKLLERQLEYCRYETRLLSSKGQVLWAEIYFQPILDKHGKVIGLSGTLTDITERKATEVQIQKLAAFPQVNPNPVLEFDAEGKLGYANNAAFEMMKALSQQSLPAILPPDSVALARDCLATGQNKLRQEVRINSRIITWSFFPVVASKVVHCYGTDVTDVLELEAQFRHAQKLESVGQLAAGVAHDFNNILTVIQGHSELLLGGNMSERDVGTALKQISLASQRAASLTRQLLMFSRKQVSQPKLLDLNAVLQNLVSMLSRLLGEDIALKNSYATALPPIEADLGMLEQVVMNLAVNSRDAMPKGGRLNISTAEIEIGQDYVTKRADARIGRFVCMSVSDTGCGMDAQTVVRIFEPFFTTKEVGKGTGLGLATVYGIVQQHRGWIEVSSEPGQGTTFKIYLPAAQGAALPAADTAFRTASVRGGTETILLVEDETMLREIVADVLAQQGYQVLQAVSAVEALQIWDKQDGRIDFLLTDMIMPEGMGGMDLAIQLRQRKPELKILFMSGYSSEFMSGTLKLEGSGFLAKPFQPSKLVQAIRHVLDGPSPHASTAIPGKTENTSELVPA